jgi:hypothetical protein
VTHHQQLAPCVEVLVIKTDRLPDPEPADRQSADGWQAGKWTCPEPDREPINQVKPDRYCSIGFRIQVSGYAMRRSFENRAISNCAD